MHFEWDDNKTDDLLTERINKKLTVRGDAEENKRIEGNGGKSWLYPSTRQG